MRVALYLPNVNSLHLPEAAEISGDREVALAGIRTTYFDVDATEQR